jgi:hypothetical protein
MGRVRIPLTVETHVSVKKEPSGAATVVEAVSGASISGTNRVTSAAAKFYSTETSETPVVSPVTDENGNIPYWIEEGAWTITAEGGTPSIAPVTYSFDALSGRGTSKIATGAVVGSMLANEAVGTAQLAKEGVVASKIAESTITSVQISPGSIKTPSLENSAVTFAKMAGPYCTVLATALSLPSQGGSSVCVAPINFTAHGGHCFAIWSATGYTELPEGSFAFQLDLDNVYTGSQSFLAMNGAIDIHKTFPTVVTSLGVLTSTHSLRIRSSAFLSTNSSDVAYLSVIEIP